MTFLSVDTLSKRFGTTVLFENLTFGLSRGDKTALVAPNGTGKSTLLKVLAGREPADRGEVMVQNGIRIALLEQEPELDEKRTIREVIRSGSSPSASLYHQYQKAAEAQAVSFDEASQRAYEEALSAMDAAGAWDYEQRLGQILGKLDIRNLDQSVATLSGGERKRVALAFTLLDEPDLLLLDEPTNHLDLEMVEWLENYLTRSNMTLLMVTHDRYFLDRVCNHILEIDNGKLYHHKGNYSTYLQNKSEREEAERTARGKNLQHYKRELEWMRRGPKARTTKSKSRIRDFHETAGQLANEPDSAELQLDMQMSRLGDKILEMNGVKKRFGDTVILENFTYSFQKGERIGIIGRNGAGKSTFLNILTGTEPVDEGDIVSGSTVRFGHYRQQGLEADPEMRVIEVLKERAEAVQLSDGSHISASKFLEHFLFTGDMQYTQVSKLSGGERRRLALMMVLIEHPNFLILDEPTNDLDLITLSRLESFLEEFGGCLIIVSHDRFFMDRLVQHYFVFEGDGRIRDFNGTYQEYRAELAQQEAATRKEAQKDSGRGRAAESAAVASSQEGVKSDRLSWKERKRFQNLEEQIGCLESEKRELETALSGKELDDSDLQQLSNRYGELQQELDQLENEWMEMAERAG